MRTTRLGWGVWAGLALVVVAVAVGVGVVVSRDEGGGRDRSRGSGVGDRSVFSQPTGNVLLFDDGYDGVLAVDLDRGIAARRVVRGQRAGDQQPRLSRAGDDLIVGWGEIWAAPLDGGRSRRLGKATISVPAVETGRVWLVDYPGGRIGAGVPTIRQVTLDGEVLVQAAGPDPSSGYPATGVPDGLAFETPSGVASWNARSGQFTRRLGSGVGWVGDAIGGRLAWCEDACTTMHVWSLTGKDVLLSAPGASTFEPRSARFSPDGSHVALTSTMGIAVADLRTGTVRLVSDVSDISLPASLEWSPDGSQLYFASYSYGKAATLLGRYDVDQDRAETVSLPFGGALGFVVIDRSEARSFFPAQSGRKAECPPPTVCPSGRSGACGFEFRSESRAP